jgi:hypothetical protein
MPERLLRVLSLGVFGSLVAVLAATSTAQEPNPPSPRPAQPAMGPVPLVNPVNPDPEPLPLPQQGGQPVQPPKPEEGDGIEVLAKGPVHEAFATTAEAATASAVVAKQPPEPIEELPPDQKPEGDNVQWLPGYWSWDEDAEKFIWVSGFWRQPPPGRVWVPGSWREVKGGWQWVSGFWQEVNPLPLPNQNQQQPQPEIEYLPEPPATLESGPSVVSPGESYFYSPGCWVWRGRYVWRPGVWVAYRPNWIWVPACYHWTPAGYVFCEGYWDYPLARRGVLFAPVVFVQPIYTRPAFVYTPVYVVSEPCMVGALFVRRGYGHYYFGDYFDNRYAVRGYSAWCGVYTRTGFTIGFGVGRTWGYDPLWSYYSVAYRETPTWRRGVGDLYSGRYRGEIQRPPTTLVHQNTTINNITKVNVTNVTNNITVVNGITTVNNKNVSNVTMVAPLKVAPDLQQTKFHAINTETRRNEATQAKQIRDVATQRTRLETAVAQQPHVPTQPGTAVQPRSIKLDVPKTAIIRAQVNDEKKAPPPSPIVRPATPTTKTDPPKVDLKLPVHPAPKVDLPKVDPKPLLPPGAPLPKVDSKPAVPAPKVDLPKVDPKSPGTPLPKVDSGPVVPKGDSRPLPKVDPKLPAHPAPKGDPKSPGNPPPKGNSGAERPVALPPVQQPKPVVVSPPVQQPNVVQTFRPVVNPQPQPRPTVSAPATQPPRTVQPPRATPPVQHPQAKPAPPGKPRTKARRDQDD